MIISTNINFTFCRNEPAGNRVQVYGVRPATLSVLRRRYCLENNLIGGLNKTGGLNDVISRKRNHGLSFADQKLLSSGAENRRRAKRALVDLGNHSLEADRVPGNDESTRQHSSRVSDRPTQNTSGNIEKQRVGSLLTVRPSAPVARTIPVREVLPQSKKRTLCRADNDMPIVTALNESCSDRVWAQISSGSLTLSRAGVVGSVCNGIKKCRKALARQEVATGVISLTNRED